MALTPVVRDVGTKHPGYLLAYLINVAISLYFGVTAMAMPGRFGAVTYDALRHSLGIFGWGVVLTVYGVALICSSAWRVEGILAVFFLGGSMYLLMGLWFGIGLTDPNASPWGPGAFGGFGLWQLTQWWAYVNARQEIAHRAIAQVQAATSQPGAET